VSHQQSARRKRLSAISEQLATFKKLSEKVFTLLNYFIA
jgi:hypothetical protein